MTTAAYADLFATDRRWFAENPEMTFRYHILDSHGAAQLVNAEYGAPLDPDDGQYRFVLAWRADRFGDIAHAWVDMPLDEVGRWLDRSPKEHPDRFGLWLMFADVPIRPRRPYIDEVPVGRNLSALVASRLAAA